MTELLEIVFAQPPADHSPEDSECPFCPVDDENESFTTYGGDKNVSSVLAHVMQDPQLLTQKQKGARPKDGAAKRQSASRAQREPQFSDKKYGSYSFEAHHAIPGGQVLKRHKIKAWLEKDHNKIKSDTGYSVNNADNGIWLPSIPNSMKDGKWGNLVREEKLAAASMPMAKGYGQFHKGPHSLKANSGGIYHKSYSDAINRALDDINNVITEWSQLCPMCDDADPQAGPFQPNWKVHDMLDRLSQAIRRDLRAPPLTWEYFISSLARDYHKSLKR